MKHGAFFDICTFDELNENFPLIFSKGIEKLDYIKKQFRKGKINDDCLQCPNLCKKKWTKIKLTSISYININHYTGCNLKCVYCGWHKLKGIKTTDYRLVLNAIRALKENNYLADNCMIAIGGGGEPSLYQDIILLAEYCIANGMFLDIHSNAARYIELFAKACEDNSAQLVISSDAGSVEVFKKIKQVDDFINTWANISKYMQNTSKNVFIKYLIQPDNMNDTNDFIDCCVKYNVRIVMIDLVVGMKCEKDDIMNSVRNIRKLCENNNIECIRGIFLPSEYFL
jgi:molybdenum cofactor biosynthesis enzyme MoaA